MITYNRVRELFDYRPDGMLIWKVTKTYNAEKGNVAGTINNHGYCMIQIDGKAYPVHRLIWLYHYGYLPEHGLDHTNRIKTDNKIGNLREVSNQCNLRNTGNYKSNKSGVKGVYKHPSWTKWRASIRVNNKSYHLGYFDNFDEAVLMRLAAEQCLDWSNCDPSSPAYKYALGHGLIKRKDIE